MMNLDLHWVWKGSRPAETPLGPLAEGKDVIVSGRSEVVRSCTSAAQANHHYSHPKSEHIRDRQCTHLLRSEIDAETTATHLALVLTSHYAEIGGPCVYALQYVIRAKRLPNQNKISIRLILCKHE